MIAPIKIDCADSALNQGDTIPARFSIAHGSTMTLGCSWSEWLTALIPEFRVQKVDEFNT